MKYPQMQETLARSQYERFTKRKWDAATVQDKSLWLDGAAADLYKMEIREPSDYSGGNMLLPRSLSEELGKTFGQFFVKRIAGRTLEQAIVAAYSDFTEYFYK